jgi:endonuclease/exonuclease/phosphatase (EEP) superfamily protein YafD
VCSGLLLVALARLAGPVPLPAVVLVQGLVPLLLLAAYPLLVFALSRRRATLAAAAAVVAAAHLWWTVPDLGWGGAADAADGSAGVRLVTANLAVDNPDVGRLAAAVLAQQPDIVTLQELSPAHLDTLRAAGFLDTFPYRVLDPLEGVHGSALLSRLPFDDGRVVDVAGYPMTEATVRTPLGPLDVLDVHVVAPLSRAGFDRWRAQLDSLARHRAPPGALLVLAGDFNATGQHEPLAGVVRGGRHDAFVSAGRGFGATWPATGTPLGALLPPFLRLDHVIVDRGLAVIHAGTLDSHGSDHRLLVVDLSRSSR